MAQSSVPKVGDGLQKKSGAVFSISCKAVSPGRKDIQVGTHLTSVG